MEKIADIYAKKIKSAIAKHMGNQESLVIGRINASKKNYQDWLFDIKPESEKLAEILTPIIIELMKAEGEDVTHFVTGELLVISPEIRQDVEQKILKLSGVYNEETIKALENTLAEGQKQGESLVKLKKRVESVYSDAKGYRAQRIALTESHRAANTSAELVYKQSGYTKSEWYVNPGACQFCLTLMAQPKTIGTDFLKKGDTITGTEGGVMTIDYDDVAVPPLHPNCKCSLVPGK